VLYLGATPVFVDSEATSWNLCPRQLKSAILDRVRKGRKPKAILAVHMYGSPYDHQGLKEVASEFDIPILEDAAEALGSSYKGIPCGTMGDLAVFSFNGNKVITSTSGGALICRSAAQEERARFLATHSRDNLPYYQHSELGFNYGMSGLCAELGSLQLRTLSQQIALREAINAKYASAFNDESGIFVFSPGSEMVWNHWLSCVLIDPEQSGFTAEQLRERLAEHGIEARRLWKPMHTQPLFKDCAYYGERISETFFDRGLCLPSGAILTDEQQAKVVHLVKTMNN
jgi:dTDP-4-amino-4,6-dideoxygalactose transaminase